MQKLEQIEQKLGGLQADANMRAINGFKIHAYASMVAMIAHAIIAVAWALHAGLTNIARKGEN